MHQLAPAAICCLAFSIQERIFHAEKSVTPNAKASLVSKPQIDEASHTGAAWENDREEADWDEKEEEIGKPDALGEVHVLSSALSDKP